jgi:folate-binding protein YgfZ
MIFRGISELHYWQPAAWLHVTGADAFAFLQGQFTNDLRPVASGNSESVYGLWLNQKGRVLADSFVLRGRADDFWIASYFSTAAAIRERLEPYIIADDVAIEDMTGSCGAVTLPFDTAAENQPASSQHLFTFPGRRGGPAMREWIFPSTMRDEVVAALENVRAIDATAMERRRIEAGISAVPVDIGPGELPNEGNLEGEAISFTKGCYLGQEVMARLKSMGQVRRRLVRIRGSGNMPITSSPVFQGGRLVGTCRSVVADGADFVGFALVNLLNFGVGAGISVAPDQKASIAIEEIL